MMFCKHNYHVIASGIVPSQAEVMWRTFGGTVKMTEIAGDFFKETHYTVLCCKKCGKAKKVVVKS